MLLTLDVTALSRVERLALAHMMSEHLGARVPTLGTALAEAVTAAADARPCGSWRPRRGGYTGRFAVPPSIRHLPPLNGPKWTPMSRHKIRSA